jgi:hypothetical protein
LKKILKKNKLENLPDLVIKIKLKTCAGINPKIGIPKSKYLPARDQSH